MRRRRTNAKQGDDEEWLVTYADAITLLLAFFVMLVSFSSVDIPLMEEVQAGIKEQIGGRVDSDRPIFALHSNVQAIVDTSETVPPGDVRVGFDDEGVVIDFVTGSFFKDGTVELTDPAKLILKQIKLELELAPYDIYEVDVEGHTDDVPIESDTYPSNWEFSAQQAARVVRELVGLGMDPTRLKAAGFAGTRPVIPPLDLMGVPVPENRRINRRLSVRLHPP